MASRSHSLSFNCVLLADAFNKRIGKTFTCHKWKFYYLNGRTAELPPPPPLYLIHSLPLNPFVLVLLLVRLFNLILICSSFCFCFAFLPLAGTPINRLPIMAKSVLDLYELYNLVIARGGLVDVINKKLWQEIIKGLHLPSSITSAAFTLRTQ